MMLYGTCAPPAVGNKLFKMPDSLKWSHASMSGYDKHPDYGGPPVTWRFYTVIAALVGGFVCVVLCLKFA